MASAAAAFPGASPWHQVRGLRRLGRWSRNPFAALANDGEPHAIRPLPARRPPYFATRLIGALRSRPKLALPAMSAVLAASLILVAFAALLLPRLLASAPSRGLARHASDCVECWAYGARLIYAARFTD